MRRLVAAASLAVLALSALAGADAAPDRAEYVSRLESVCKPGVEDTQRAVRGVRSDIRRERLAVAARKLSSAGRIFDGTVRSDLRRAAPPADAAQLAKWFGYLRLQESYLRQGRRGAARASASSATSTTPCASSTPAISPTTW